MAAAQWICGECYARRELAALIERRRILTATIDDLLAQRETLTGQIDDLGRHVVALKLNGGAN
jgi:hypothetical protein